MRGAVRPELVERFVERFDHHAPEFSHEELPFRVYSELRRRRPVAHTEAHGGFWVVSRYRDVAAVARDDDTFRSAPGITIPSPYSDDLPEQVRARLPVPTPIMVDPPQFFGYRKLLNPLFTKAQADAREPEIRALVGRLIDGFIGRGAADLHEELSKPLPGILTCRLLGIPEAEWRRFADPFHQSIHERSTPEAEKRNRDVQVQNALAMQQMVEARRSQPRDDIMSFLAKAEIEGRRLEPREILGICSLVLVGGVDTTTNGLGSALVYLARNPPVRQRLIDSPSLIPVAIEEFLRMWAPVTGLARTASRACEIAGQRIRAGERVLMLWASANRDPEEFPDPDRVDIERSPNRHTTFGLGIHRCLGSHLARLQFRVALEEVLARLPDYTLDEAGLRLSPDVGTVFGYVGLPARFAAGEREPRGTGARCAIDA
jgi:cytochrome P450